MSAKEVSAKTIKIHAILVFVVCILFGLISFVRKAFFMGLCTVGMGAVIPLVALVLMRNSSKIARGIFLTQATTVVIVVLSAAQGELHSMFALLAGNIAIGSIYYNLNNIKYAWILSDVILITACLFKDIVYVGADLSLIIKGILGLNIAALMVRILLKDCIDSLRSAEEARTEAAELLTQVRTQMAEGQKLTEQQKRTVPRAASKCLRDQIPCGCHQRHHHVQHADRSRERSHCPFPLLGSGADERRGRKSIKSKSQPWQPVAATVFCFCMYFSSN